MRLRSADLVGLIGRLGVGDGVGLGDGVTLGCGRLVQELPRYNTGSAKMSGSPVKPQVLTCVRV